MNLVGHAVWNFAIAAFFLLGPIVAKEKLGGASSWGLMAASLGAGAVLNEVWFATVPQLIPADVQARAVSFDWLLSLIAMPIGFAVAGPVADRIGVQQTLMIAAGLLVVPSLLVLLISGVRRVARTPEGVIVLEGAPGLAHAAASEASCR